MQLYPIENVPEQPLPIVVTSVHPERREDPMFGQAFEYNQEVGFGLGYLTQVSSSDGPSDESYQKKVVLFLSFSSS